MPRARPKVANIVGMLSSVGLMAIWVLMLNPLKASGFLPRKTAVGALIISAFLSLLASRSGPKAWLVLSAAIIPTLAFVLFFYRPLY
jgi:hypothetical protein